MPQIVSPPENKIPEKRPIITTCPHCQYTISYTEDEVDRIGNESMGVFCPQCKAMIETEHIEPFTFPNTFYHCGESKDAMLLTDEEIQKYVNAVKRQLQQELKVGEFTSAATGDTIIFGFKFEDEDNIIVAKNYWEESVFKED